jgi:choline/glycine/proline betaine transport protein
MSVTEDPEQPPAPAPPPTPGAANGASASAPEETGARPRRSLRLPRQFTDGFWAALAILTFAAGAGSLLMWPDQVGAALGEAKGAIIAGARSPLLLVSTAAVVTAIGIILSPAGARRIAASDDKAIGNIAWFSLMFCAGTLSGLLIWATAEPLYHLLGNPLLTKGQAETAAATAPALRLTLFHWALHPWALFSLVGVSLAWGTSQHQLPLRPSSALAPLFQTRPPSWLALPVDVGIVAIVLLSLSVFLGLGALQAETAISVIGGEPPISSAIAAAEAKARAAAQAQGLSGGELTTHVRSLLPTMTPLLVALAILGGAGIAGAFLGVRRGIGAFAILAVTGLGLLLLATTVAGHSLYILDSWINALGDYLANLVNLSLMTRPNQSGDAWQGWWTVFYFGTWIAMAPMVGLLMASVSGGRTVRAMLMAGFVIPAATTSLVVGILGGGALHIELFGDDGLIEPLKQDPTFALYEMLKTFAPADDGGGGLGLLPAGAGLVQLAALIAGVAAGMLVLRKLFGGARHWLDLPAIFAMVVVVGAAAALWQTLGSAGWQSARTALFLMGLPAGLFAIAAVIGFLRPARTPPTEATEPD